MPAAKASTAGPHLRRRRIRRQATRQDNSTSNGARNWAAWTTKSSRPPFPTAARRSPPSPDCAKRCKPCPFSAPARSSGCATAIFSATNAPPPPQAVTETLAELAEELKDFTWQGVRLLISAGKVDKRKTFFKTLDKIGTVESFCRLVGGRPGLGGTRGSRGAHGRARAAKGNFRGGAGRTGQPRRAQSAPA